VYGAAEPAAAEVSAACDSIEVVGDEKAPRADEVLEFVTGDETAPRADEVLEVVAGDE
jgi:hypothetical protein